MVVKPASAPGGVFFKLPKWREVAFSYAMGMFVEHSEHSGMLLAL